MLLRSGRRAGEKRGHSPVARCGLLAQSSSISGATLRQCNVSGLYTTTRSVRDRRLSQNSIFPAHLLNLFPFPSARIQITGTRFLSTARARTYAYPAFPSSTLHLSLTLSFPLTFTLLSAIRTFFSFYIYNSPSLQSTTQKRKKQN